MAMYLSGNNLRQIFFYLLGSVRAGVVAAAGSSRCRSSPSDRSLILTRARSLNALLLGEETAAHLGLDVRRERLDPARRGRRS